jgi:hypothetical protein
MYQAPPPIKKVFLDQTSRAAIGIGVLGGVIVAHLAMFEIWPGHGIVSGLVRLASPGLCYLPYLLLDDLALVDWLKRARVFLWLYGAVSVATLHRMLTGPWQVMGLHWLGIALFMLLGLYISLRAAREKIRPML